MSNVEFQILDDGCYLTLSGKLDVFEAPALLQAARQAAAIDRPLIIHTEGLERVDASIFQILLALQREVQRQGRVWHVRGTRPSVQRLGELLGGDQSPLRCDS
jgi:anti-anti-sigma regulatory factor